MDEPSWVAEPWRQDAPPQAAYAPPPPPHRRRWVLPVVIVASVVVVTLVVVAAVNLFSYALSRGSALDQPLATGDPGSPVAVSPVVCPDACFTGDSIEATVAADSSFSTLGVPEATFPYGTYDPITVGELYRRDSAGWKSYNGSPDECFFAPTSGPYAATLDDATSESTDLMYFTGTHEDVDRLNSLDQSVRLFPDSASADAFMDQLATNISDCTEVSLGPASNRYSATIVAQPALDIPDTMAAVGWSRTGTPGERWRAYVVDIQYGNMIVMVRMLTDGSITEDEFRSFVEDYAPQLEGVQPPTTTG